MALVVGLTTSADCAAPAPPVPAASPSAAQSAGGLEVRRFQVAHQFLDFVVDGDTLFFSGSDYTTSAIPDVYSYSLVTGAESLVARASSVEATISPIAHSDGWLVFAETFPAGRVVYRIRAIGPARDLTLDELTAPSEAEASAWRSLVPLPMVTTARGIAAWTSVAPAATPTFLLKAADLSTGRRLLLRSAPQWLSYPSLSGDTLVFTDGHSPRGVWAIRPFLESEPRRLLAATDVSEAAVSGDIVAFKKGGRDALDPAAIGLLNLATKEELQIAPASEMAWQPTVGQRYVVWQGLPHEVRAYDLVTRQVVVLARAERDANGRNPGLMGRMAAFGPWIVWLSSPPGDTLQVANVKPTFNVLHAP